MALAVSRSESAYHGEPTSRPKHCYLKPRTKLNKGEYMKRIKCWLTRHHWLLQETTKLPFENDYNYLYECQVCGKELNQLVTHID